MQGEATDPGRLAILNARRNAVLDEIHFREKQLNRLNYLRYEIEKKNRKNKSKNRNKNTLLISINAVSRVKFL